MQPADFSEGVNKFLEFHALEPSKVGEFAKSFKIPKKTYRVGEAEWIAYRSTKWEGKHNSYMHEHELGVYTHRADAPNPGPYESVITPEWILEARTLIRLGDCLGFSYYHNGSTEARMKRPYPELYCVPSGKALIIVVDKASVAVLLWGGMLDVTARGIVG